MPTVIVMDLARSSPAQQSHHGSFECLGHDGDISDQASHHQQLCSSITPIGSSNPLQCDEEKRLREVESHTRDHIAGWQSQAQAQVSSQVQRYSGLELADIRCAPTLCKGTGYCKQLPDTALTNLRAQGRKQMRCDGDR